MISRRGMLKAGLAAAVSVPGSMPWGRSSMAAGTEGASRLVAAEPPLPSEKNAFTMIVLPDTQHYSEMYPEQFLAQTRWIVEQKNRRNVACVLHLGDLTNRNTPAEWENAKTAMTQLDEVVPYFMAVGNHDYSESGTCRDRSTRFNQYFPLDKYRVSEHFGGVYDREPNNFENSFHLLSAGTQTFLILSLEFGPRADVIRWANEVAAAHSDRDAILITHAYMYSDDTRYDWSTRGTSQSWNPHSYGVAKASHGDVSDGEAIWKSLVSRHDHFILTLNGHVLNDGLGRLRSTAAGGQEVDQLLVNFQMKPNGGDGWLRLLEFRDEKVIQVYDYSPTLDLRNDSPGNRFLITR